MAIITSIRNGQGTITGAGGGPYTTTGVQEDDLLFTATDFVGRAGVINLSTDFIVSQRGAGANKSVDVSLGTAYVLNSSWNANNTTNTKLWRVVNDGTINVAVTDNASGNPRIDIVCIKFDTAATPDANATNVASIVVVAGTPGSTPAVPATPSNYLKLAELVVANGFSSIVTANITDRRVSAYIQNSANDYPNTSMARQAVMNGNFDIWQRGTSVSITDVTQAYCADRWGELASKDGGTLPTLTRSRQVLTSGDIPNAFYYTRLTTNGAGTSLGVGSYHFMYQKIEHGARNLCGLNKKITVSFWARSSISNKRISATFYQDYGTGGSPSSLETIKSIPITLTANWTLYTYTFTTNTLVGKTFGTNNDDNIQLRFYYMWGTTLGNSDVQTGVTAETYVGSGNIDIAQVQLCAGDVALPFQPKTFEEELRQCQRYYEKSYDYITPPQTVIQTGAQVWRTNGTDSFHMSYVTYKVAKRTNATPSIYSTQTGTVDKVYDASVGDIAGAIDTNYVSQRGFNIQLGNVSTVTGHTLVAHWVASAEL